MKISIITVVKNDAEKLAQTAQSIKIQKERNRVDVEWIIIDGVSTDNILGVIDKYEAFIDIFVSENDGGIYDAMNKGICLANGDGLLFINAGDLLVGEVLDDLKDLPIFLPVFYHDIFGRFKKIKIKSIREAIPNCHQGIVFPRTDLKYSLIYKICADYDYFIRHNFNGAVPFSKNEGYVYFSPGISSSSYRIRDDEIFNIRKKYFGLFVAIIYEWRNFLKRIVRRLVL